VWAGHLLGLLDRSQLGESGRVLLLLAVSEGGGPPGAGVGVAQVARPLPRDLEAAVLLLEDALNGLPHLQ